MDKTYTTIAGDMWDGIAYKVYGNEAHTDKLMKRNAKYRQIVVFPAGITLDTPVFERESTAQLPPWKRGGQIQ